ncbi:hypothetical protein HHI36_019630, partial [Cryptolaemus montrouzieri]
VHRNTMTDDVYGVEEPLLEKAFGVGLVARGSHFLVAGYTSNKRGGMIWYFPFFFI